MTTHRIHKHGEDDGKDRRRVEIRDRALELFRRHGYKKTSLDDVARACGLVKGALYYYFASKEALFLDVVRTVQEQQFAEVKQAVDRVSDPRDKLFTFVRTRFTLLSKYLGDERLADDLSALLPQVNEARRDSLEREAQLLAGILAEGQRREVFSKTMPKSLPHLILACFRGIELYFAELKTRMSVERALDDLLQLTINGIQRMPHALGGPP